MAKKSATESSTSEQPTDAGTVPSGTTAAAGDRITKTKAFDMAMQTLGRNAEPIDIQKWVKEQYNLDIKLSNIASYKSIWKKQNRRKPGPKPGQRSAANGPVAGGKDEVTVDEIRNLTDMIRRMGVARFRQLVELLCM